MESNIDFNKKNDKKCTKILEFYNTCNQNIKIKDEVDNKNLNNHICTILKINWENCVFKNILKDRKNI